MGALEFFPRLPHCILSSQRKGKLITLLWPLLAFLSPISPPSIRVFRGLSGSHWAGPLPAHRGSWQARALLDGLCLPWKAEAHRSAPECVGELSTSTFLGHGWGLNI